MTPSYSFDVDPQRSLVRLRISGFFMPADIDRFAAARADAYGVLLCAANEHVTLVDMRGMQIQSQECVDGFARVLGDPRHRSRRIAFVVERSLSRMQIQRITMGRAARYFTAIEAAEAWLLGDVDNEEALAPVSSYPNLPGRAARP